MPHHYDDDDQFSSLQRVWEKTSAFSLGTWVVGTLLASLGLGGLAAVHRLIPALDAYLHRTSMADFVESWGFGWALLCCAVGLHLGSDRDLAYRDKGMAGGFFWTALTILGILLLNKALPHYRR